MTFLTASNMMYPEKVMKAQLSSLSRQTLDSQGDTMAVLAGFSVTFHRVGLFQAPGVQDGFPFISMKLFTQRMAPKNIYILTSAFWNNTACAVQSCGVTPIVPYIAEFSYGFSSLWKLFGETKSLQVSIYNKNIILRSLSLT